MQLSVGFEEASGPGGWFYFAFIVKLGTLRFVLLRFVASLSSIVWVICSNFNNLISSLMFTGMRAES